MSNFLHKFRNPLGGYRVSAELSGQGVVSTSESSKDDECIDEPSNCKYVMWSFGKLLSTASTSDADL